MAETSLSPPPGRRPLVDRGGHVQEHWWRWFEQLWRRVGQANAPSITDLVDAGASLGEQIQAIIAALAEMDARSTMDETPAYVIATRKAVLAELARVRSELERQLDTPSPWAFMSQERTRRRAADRDLEAMLLFT